MFGREAAAKHMLLTEESTKYVGDSEGILNLKLMQQLYHVVAYNLAKIQDSKRWKQDPEEKELQTKASQTKWSCAGKRSYFKGI